MPARLLLAAIAAATLAPLCPAGTPCFMDPVTTYTNGIALPSTDPMRSHNVYWQCDPYRRSCCGNHYNFACVSFALFPNTCCSDPKGYLPGDDCRCGSGSFESVESQEVVTLGQLPPPMNGVTGIDPRRNTR